MTNNSLDKPVAEVLQEIRLKIRQRQAEQAIYLQKGFPTQRTQLSQQLTQLRAKSLVSEQPFVSRVPIFGRFIEWFRHSWNNIAARWHVWHILKQQNSFNQTVVETFQEMVYMQNRLADINLQIEMMEQQLKELEHKANHDKT